MAAQRVKLKTIKFLNRICKYEPNFCFEFEICAKFQTVCHLVFNELYRKVGPAVKPILRGFNCSTRIELGTWFAFVN